jgi:hypothetical protein
MSDQHLGGCLCGAVRYAMAGAPMHTSICYCTQCQRETGAPMPAFACCRIEQLTIISGSTVSYRSSERASREFCATCGSNLFWREDGAGDVDVFLGTFDEPSRLPRPKYAIWAAHRVPWLPDLDGVPTFAARRPT